MSRRNQISLGSFENDCGMSAVEFMHKLDFLFIKGKLMNLYKELICLFIKRIV